MLTDTKESETQRLLVEGEAAARRGDAEGARAFLSQVVEIDPGNESAWMWLSGVVEDASEQQICLENVLVINPENDKARQGLEYLKTHLSTTQAEPPTPAYASDYQPITSDRTSPLGAFAPADDTTADPPGMDFVPDWVPNLGSASGSMETNGYHESPPVGGAFSWEGSQGAQQAVNAPMTAYGTPFDQEPVDLSALGADFPFDTSSLRESDVAASEDNQASTAASAGTAEMSFDVQPFASEGSPAASPAALPEFDFSSFSMDSVSDTDVSTTSHSASSDAAPGDAHPGVLDIKFEDHVAAQAAANGSVDSGFMSLPAGTLGNMVGGDLGPMGPMSDAQLPPPTALPGYDGGKGDWSQPWYLESAEAAGTVRVEEPAGVPSYSSELTPDHLPRETATKATVSTMPCPNCREQVADTSLACPNCRFHFFINCPHCHELLDASGAVAGKMEQCAHCQKEIDMMALGSVGADGAIMYQSTKLNKDAANAPAMQSYGTDTGPRQRIGFGWVVDLVWLVTIIAIVWALTQLPTWLHLTGQY